jgi:hypothetical protein
MPQARQFLLQRIQRQVLHFDPYDYSIVYGGAVQENYWLDD